jgi:hypothetical protein
MASPRYSITCPCGQPHEGRRPARVQAISCANCGQQLLVFPVSKIARLVPQNEQSNLSGSNRWPWWKPILATVTALLLVAILLYFFFFGKPTPDEKRPPREVETEIRQLLRRGEFDAAVPRLEQWVRILPKERAAVFQHLVKQASLVREVVPGRVPIFLREAQRMEAEEWQERFRRDYLNRGMLFDLTLQVNAEGELLPEPLVTEADLSITLEFPEVRLLQQLSKRRGDWFLFGLRIRDLQRDENGGWRLFFHADSGVLLTDPDVLESITQETDRDELRKRLQEQQLIWESLPRN